MRKLQLLFIALVISLGLSAQEVGDGKLGVKAGLSFASITNTNNSRITPNFGVTYEQRISQSLALSPELMFSAQGSKLRDYDVTDKINIAYINVPLIIKYYVTDMVSIDFGPQVGIMVASETKYDDGETVTKTDITSVTNNIDLSLAMGLTYSFNEKVYVSLRYNLGVVNVLDKDIFGPNKNRVFQIGLGYKF